jgi:ABC-type sugar transport system, periplasmic component
MRKTLLGFVCIMLFAVSCAMAGQTTVRYWYHTDNPDIDTIPELVAKFESENPDIKIQADSLALNSYYDLLYTAIIGGAGPDVAMIKLTALPQLLAMEALEPLDDYIAKWDGKDDILDDLWGKMVAPDGKTYILPMQYIISYLYYRADLFAEHNVKVPTNEEEFLAAAKALTLDTNNDGRIDIYGYGFRGAVGGAQEHWGAFVLPNAREMTTEQLLDPRTIEMNQFVIDLFRVHKVVPPSAPNDGFNEVTTAFRSGLTAMTIHHIGSSARMVEALGDKVSAVPVPRDSKTGAGWTNFGDEEHSIMAASKNKDAAWRWMTFLSTAENNNRLVYSTGQLPVTKSGSENWDLHEKRFLDATIESLPIAAALPPVPESTEFIFNVWPSEMQRAMLGEIDSRTMMEMTDKLFNK